MRDVLIYVQCCGDAELDMETYRESKRGLHVSDAAFLCLCRASMGRYTTSRGLHEWSEVGDVDAQLYFGRPCQRNVSRNLPIVHHFYPASHLDHLDAVRLELANKISARWAIKLDWVAWYVISYGMTMNICAHKVGGVYEG